MEKGRGPVSGMPKLNNDFMQSDRHPERSNAASKRKVSFRAYSGAYLVFWALVTTQSTLVRK